MSTLSPSLYRKHLLSFGFADHLFVFQNAEAIFYITRCPPSLSSVKQLLGSHVPLLLVMLTIAKWSFVTCMRGQMMARKSWMTVTRTASFTDSGWCSAIKSVYLKGVYSSWCAL